MIDGLVDFVLEVEEQRSLRILQITDTQVIDASQSRYEDRLNSLEKINWATNTMEANCFNYIKDLVKKTNPDLILITGDLVYGEFDDLGTSLKKYVKFMDGFEIPWAPIFGNHDNESINGVDWQCEVLENAEYSFFKRGNVTGNSNYTIGIVQSNELKRVIYMMDSNGCGNTQDPKIKRTVGFAEDQLIWFDETASRIESYAGNKVRSFVCYHIPTQEFALAATCAGYQQTPCGNVTYTIGVDVPANNCDFGRRGEIFKGLHPVPGLLYLFKKHYVDGVFVGHSHLNSISVLYDGIRWTFGLKTGTYDRYDVEMLGGTFIEVCPDNSFKVEHVYQQKYTD
jgi:predicted phosphodiesterase